MERAREGVVTLLNDVWNNVVIDFGYVSSRILWIKFSFSMVKVCVVGVTAKLKELVKKGRGSGMTWIGLRPE